MRTTHKAMLMAFTILAVSGCAGRRAPAELPPVADSGYDANANTGGVTNAVVPGSQADFVRSVSSDVIYFDTDRYNIDDIDRAALTSQAEWLRRYPNVRATVEGHADERGTREYNIALGERRANAARNFLISLGIDGARLSVISYGKERPVALGSDESAWAQNRRAVTVTVQ